MPATWPFTITNCDLQQEEESQKAGQHGDNYQQQEHGEDGRQQQYQYQQDSRGQQRDPRDSHHSNYGSTNGGYSVANSSNYMGQPKGQGYGGYDDSDQSSRDDDMW